MRQPKGVGQGVERVVDQLGCAGHVERRVCELARTLYAYLHCRRVAPAAVIPCCSPYNDFKSSNECGSRCDFHIAVTLQLVSRLSGALSRLVVALKSTCCQIDVGMNVGAVEEVKTHQLKAVNPVAGKASHCPQYSVLCTAY